MILINTWRDVVINNYDYIVDNYIKIKGKYKIIDESINYYLGILEYTIFLLKKMGNTYIGVNEKKICECLKRIFYLDICNKSIEINKVIKSVKNYCNWHFVIIRMIYPNYYFYHVDMAINGVFNEKSIVKIVSKRKEYFEYIKFVMDILYKNKKIEVSFFNHLDF